VEKRPAEREKVTTIASLRALLKPHSIAVIGASRKQGTIGNKLFHNILPRVQGCCLSGQPKCGSSGFGKDISVCS